MKHIDIKKLIIRGLPFVFFFYLTDKAGQAFRLAYGADIGAKILNIVDGFAAAFQNPLPSLHTQDLLIGLIGAAILFLALTIKRQNAKKYRKGIEYGSARWGTAQDIKPYIDPVFENNVLLTQTERLTMNSRPKNPAHARNKNVICIGGSGSGKTRFFVKPNLMQMHSSYVVTDPKGTVLVECGSLLQKGGYRIKVLNTINFKKSMRYNPFPLLYKGGKRTSPKIQGSHYVCGTQTDGHGIGYSAGKGKVMNELTYEQAGDYLMPCIRLSDPPDAPPLGRYGTMHKTYLRENRPALYAELLLTERLYPLCREVDEAAAHRLTVIGNHETAHEVILSELVYI